MYSFLIDISYKIDIKSKIKGKDNRYKSKRMTSLVYEYVDDLKYLKYHDCYNNIEPGPYDQELTEICEDYKNSIEKRKEITSSNFLRDSPVYQELNKRNKRLIDSELDYRHSVYNLNKLVIEIDKSIELHDKTYNDLSCNLPDSIEIDLPLPGSYNEITLRKATIENGINSYTGMYYIKYTDQTRKIIQK